MHIEEGALVGGVVGSISILPASTGNPPIKAMAITIVDADDEPTLNYQNYRFIQTEALTKAGIAIHPYGAIIFNMEVTSELLTDEEVIIVEFGGKQYGIDFADISEVPIGTPIAFDLIEDEGGGGDQGSST